MEADLLCFGFFCSDKIPPDKRRKFIVKDYSHLDKRICEYIESAFECAPRNHFDIFVTEDNDRVTVSLYLAPCGFSEKAKTLSPILFRMPMTASFLKMITGRLF